MWILDTDHLTILERGGSTALPLQMRLGQVPVQEVDTTIISYEEQMRGWLARTAQAKTPSERVNFYQLLRKHIDTFADFAIFVFDEAASSQFERLQHYSIRIGTNDLKIAAVCLANDATLLTRNLKDFSKVPGLQAEDWAV